MHNFFKSKFRIATISFTKNKKHITSELNFFAQQFEKRKFCYNSDTSLAERLLICFPSRFIKEDRLFRCDKNIAAKDSKQCAWKRFIISAAKKYPPKPLDNFIIFFSPRFCRGNITVEKKKLLFPLIKTLNCERRNMPSFACNQKLHVNYRERGWQRNHSSVWR